MNKIFYMLLACFAFAKFSSTSYGCDNSEDLLTKGSVCGTVYLAGEDPFVIRWQEGITQFTSQNLAQIEEQPPLKCYPHTKLIQIQLPEFPFPGPTDYYINSTAKWTFDNYNLCKARFLPNYGFLTFPSGKGPFPCAILCHGSGGPDPFYLDYAALLASEGITSFLIDRFFLSITQDTETFESTVKDQLVLSLEREIIRTIETIKIIQSHPQINPNQIGLIGWSRGASVAWECCLAGTLEKVFPGFKPAFLGAYYPMVLLQKPESPIAPSISVFGLNDDYTPVSKHVRHLTKVCGDHFKVDHQAKAKQEFEATSEGIRTKLVVFPNAGHSFDLSINPELLIHSPNLDCFFDDLLMSARLKWNELLNESFIETDVRSMNLSDCCIEPTEDGEHFRSLETRAVYKWDQINQFLKDNMKRGVSREFNPQARDDAWKDVIQFVKQATAQRK